MEDHLRLAQDNVQLTLQRAITVEVDLLQLRVENVMRPGEARLMEIDRIMCVYVDLYIVYVHVHVHVLYIPCTCTCVHHVCSTVLTHTHACTHARTHTYGRRQKNV